MPAVTRIEAIDDPRLDVYRDVRDRDLRGHGHLFMAESEPVIRRLLGTSRRVHSLLLTPSRYARLRGVLEADARRAGLPVYVAELEVMSEVVGFRIHRGALAAVHRPPREALALDAVLEPIAARARATVLVVEGISNVDNMGALFRNAAAFGVDAIVVDPACCDPLYRKSIRVSMGHALTLPYAIAAGGAADLARLRSTWGLVLHAAEPGAGAAPPWAVPRPDRLALVLGSEARGLSPAALAACDARVGIPMADGVPSLNVATAAAVLLYEMAGRRRAGEDP